MKIKKVPMRAGLASADYLWPVFKMVDGLIFFSWCAPPSCLTQSPDRTYVEHNANHTHVLDCFSHSAHLPDEPWWEDEHPDFRAACVFGKRWAEAVAAKLAHDFPTRGFFVYYTEYDNPIVRFHQEHQGERPYMTPEEWVEEIAAETIVIHHVRARGT
ncbi:hypothetical protein M0765_002725 [Variovorax sp. S2]|jgi:hypothetical protein|uniref:hypothetical protein n=1 Tax=Variovorax sp. S12S4 TaxID=3029170 RepID=UPI00215D3DCD|nr:hypothetical protein [Variovorax sp. S12S4]MCR8956686.1 hypothetical protein [Variovorax sp. S12S4]